MEGLDEFNALLGNLPDVLAQAAETGVRRGAHAMVVAAKELCPVNTGELRNSMIDVTKRTGSEIACEVGAASEYAVFVEMGTGEVGRASGGNGSGVTKQYRTGAWFVPFSEGDKRRNDKMLGDTILERGQAGFMTRGQPARPFLYPAYKATQGKVVSQIKSAINKALKGGG